MDPFEGASSLFTYGPLGIAVAGLIWWLGVRERQFQADRESWLKERKEILEAHKVEIAAERKLNADIQLARFEDQKVLIPLSQALRTSSDAHVAALVSRQGRRTEE